MDSSFPSAALDRWLDPPAELPEIEWERWAERVENLHAGHGAQWKKGNLTCWRCDVVEEYQEENHERPERKESERW